MENPLKTQPELTQRDAEDLEKIIKLNSFLESSLGDTVAGPYNSSDLLPVQYYTKEVELSGVRNDFLEKFTLDQILEVFIKEGDFAINPSGHIEISRSVDGEMELPVGYGFKGGAARSILRKALGLVVIPPRDIDIIRLSAEPYDGADRDIAQKYMSQDFEFGDGVELVEDHDGYLNTRDFTINEVYVFDSKIIATEQCIRDTIRNTVRITEHERLSYSGDGIGPKMKAKVLRFHAEQMYAIGTSNIPEDVSNEIEKSFINPFWLCVQLDRAFERGFDVADKFTALLLENEIIPEHINNGTDLGDYLLSQVYGFRFRNAPHLQYEIEEYYNGDSDDEDDLSEADLLERYFDSIHYNSKY